LTTIVDAPPARAPRIAAFTSSAIIFRDRPYSAPAAESWSDAEMPLMPSMSAEMKTFLPLCAVAGNDSRSAAAAAASVRLVMWSVSPSALREPPLSIRRLGGQN
jgi:hypothetical protein